MRATVISVIDLASKDAGTKRQYAEMSQRSMNIKTKLVEAHAAASTMRGRRRVAARQVTTLKRKLANVWTACEKQASKCFRRRTIFESGL